MDPLHRQAIVQGVLGTLLFVVLIFWPAGTFDYWQGWLFLGIFAASTGGFTVYLAIYDRPLLERRLKAGPQHEREWSQKIIVSLVLLAFCTLMSWLNGAFVAHASHARFQLRGPRAAGPRTAGTAPARRQPQPAGARQRHRRGVSPRHVPSQTRSLARP
jgi:hypothetical protein